MSFAGDPPRILRICECSGWEFQLHPPLESRVSLCVCVFVCNAVEAILLVLGWYLSPLCKLQSSSSPPSPHLTYCTIHGKLENFHTKDGALWLSSSHMEKSENKSFSYLHFVFITFLAFSSALFSVLHICWHFFVGAVVAFRLSRLHIYTPHNLLSPIVIRMQREERMWENREIHFFPNFPSITFYVNMNFNVFSCLWKSIGS